MNERLGEVFISCSDDHHIRVYSPRDGFKFLYEDYTTRMTREWHTLTYLALEPVLNLPFFFKTNKTVL